MSSVSYDSKPRKGKLSMHAKFWLENLKRKPQLGDLDTEGKIMLSCVLQKWCRIKPIILAQDHVQCQIYIKTAMKLQIS